MGELDAAVARELLIYDQETGVIRWRKPTHKVHIDGAQAGTITTKGYRQLMIRGRTYLAHRVIWLYVYGEWPEQTIDHINSVRSDNRISNLRSVPHAINAQNIHAARSDSKSGVMGVTSRDGLFYARIWIQGHGKRLGSFRTQEEAHAAYVEAKRKHHHGYTI